MVKKIKTDITVQRDNLSFAFIAEKSVVYEEPERKGTPRGEKIGFPKKKYLASLFVGITNFKPKDLAEGLQKQGLTHGLLRKWKTEDDFKDQAEEHAEEFTSFLFKEVEKANRKHHQEYMQYYNCKIDKKPDVPQIIKKIYQEVQTYSNAVLDEISRQALGRIDEAKVDWENNEIEEDAFFLEYGIFSDFSSIVRIGKGGKVPTKMRLQFYQSTVSHVKSLIKSKRVLSKSEQRIIVDLLGGVEESLGEIIEKEA